MLILYSNGCPRCRILKDTLVDVGIEFETSVEFEKVIDKGFTSAPVLELEDKTMLTFDQAIKYIQEERS